MFRGLWAMIYKEIIHVRRDRSTRLVFMIPVIQTFIFGFAIDLDIQNISTVVVDMDRSAESRRVAGRLHNTRTFRITDECRSVREAREQIVAGRAKVAVVVPPDYSRHLLNGRQATVQVLVDGSDSVVATNAVQTARAIGLLETGRAGRLAPRE